MVGRKPKATILKILEGNPGKQKLPQGEPVVVPAEMIEPPSFLDTYAIEEWDRLAPGLYELGILTPLDRSVFAAYCDSVSEWRHARELLAEESGIDAFVSSKASGNQCKSVLLDIATSAAKNMLRYGVELGLTPSARSRLVIAPGRGKKSRFEGLIGKK
ncbi:MAG: phage terminase small subunit P27 family [Proteobacteria bacterium]|jgi:P27 family predicted phage terminase small subunit|nr:phage terminase small subunit P27 family [Pseudomonadota bacterium]